MRPLPRPDALTAPYWEGARQHRLMLQRCRDCRCWLHAPALACPGCGSMLLGFEQASGRGTLYAWTVLRDAPAPGFAELLPLIVGLVELAEQPRLLMTANLLDVAPEALRLGLPLEVTFEQVTDELTLPQFRPAAR